MDEVVEEPTTTTARNFRPSNEKTTPETTEKEEDNSTYTPEEAEANQNSTNAGDYFDIDGFIEELEGEIDADYNSAPAENVSDLVKQILVCVFTACFMS